MKTKFEDLVRDDIFVYSFYGGTPTDDNKEQRPLIYVGKVVAVKQNAITVKDLKAVNTNSTLDGEFTIGFGSNLTTFLEHHPTILTRTGNIDLQEMFPNLFI